MVNDEAMLHIETLKRAAQVRRESLEKLIELAPDIAEERKADWQSAIIDIDEAVVWLDAMLKTRHTPDEIEPETE
jgi:hypothetical protein